MHNSFCDGKGDPVDFLEKAKILGMPSVGYSSHAPLPFENVWSIRPQRLNDYLLNIQELKAAASGIEVYTGLEIDYIPSVICPGDFSDQLDFTIGSVHFVDAFPDGKHWEVDGLHTAFMTGFEAIFRSDIVNTISRYFELTREMVRAGNVDIVGHLDKIKIQNIGNKLFRETDAWYQDQVKSTLDVIASYGSIVEVNTRGIYQKKSTTVYPSPWILELILEKNIPITLNSDAHHPNDIINHFPETAAILSAIGFKKLTILHNGTWQPRPFDADGIIV